MVRHTHACRTFSKITKCQYLWEGLSYFVYKITNCQVNFLLPLKLRKISCYFRLWPQKTLGQSVCRIFYFWLVWLVNLSTEGPLLHCTCCHLKYKYVFQIYLFLHQLCSMFLVDFQKISSITIFIIFFDKMFSKFGCLIPFKDLFFLFGFPSFICCLVCYI